MGFTAMAGAAGMLILWGSVNAAGAAPRSRASSPDYGLTQVREINERIREHWREYGLSPSAPATDHEWCRRLFLDVLGRIPTVDELHAFTRDRDTNKKAKLVRTLLYDQKYTEQYARNWTTLWSNILIGRNGGMDDDSLISREGMRAYLLDAITENRPYDRLVHELVTATGTTAPGGEGFNGAVNFLVDKVNDENASLATAATSRIFLGLQVQCTQCHNHPFNEWKQQKYWEMNAFFRQTRALRRFVPGTRDIASAELVNEDFAGEGGDPREAEVYYELRNGLLKVAYPVFVEGQSIGHSGYLDEVDRRTELGDFMVKSPYLTRMIANRVWAHFLGYGFTKPIDDMGPHNAPTHPRLLEYLAEQVRDNSFDLKQLMQWIALSEAYSLSSRVNSSNESDDPQIGESPKFSRFYLRQMRAEELYQSLLVATEADKTNEGVERQEKARERWLRQFVVAFGTDEGDETTTFNGTIPQALMMFNGELVESATSRKPGSFLWNVAQGDMTPAEKIRHLYLAGLSRPPTSDEIAVANRLLLLRRGDVGAALQDVWWAVLNSNEFILNH